MSNTKNNQEIKYYSKPHGEDGFLNSLRKVESEGGDYYAIKFAARRGNSVKPRTVPYSVRVNGTQAKEVIAKIKDRLEAELTKDFEARDTIFIALNVSDGEAKSYISKNSGKTINYIDGRCTSIAYVAINDEILFKKERNNGSKPEVVPEVKGNDSEETTEAETKKLPQEVTLDPQAEDFNTRKEQLKSQGYKWDGEKKVWVLK